jgi:DNA-binding NarL/FixJ family response regulator
MRVFIVDSEPIFREGLKTIIRSKHEVIVAGEAGNCSDVLQTCSDVDLVILDGELDSLLLLHSLRKYRSPGRPPFVLVVTKHNDKQHGIEMLKAGADGYLYKSDSPATVLDAIDKIVRGEKHLPDELGDSVASTLHGIDGRSRLSRREYQVLYLFARGLRMSEIADQLSLSVKTVSTYRSRMLEKLNLNSNMQLMRYAFKEGMVS